VRFPRPQRDAGYWRDPEQTAQAFDEEGYYRTGDAVTWVDPQRPHQGLMFDGRIAEDFKLSTATFVSVGPLKARVVAGGAPLVQDVVVTGITATRSARSSSRGSKNAASSPACLIRPR
jgi:feruloyl-CoA synthase